MVGKTARALTALALTSCTTFPADGAPSANEAEPAQSEAEHTNVTIPADQRTFLDACKKWDDWDKAAPPFKVHGDTYYVGTCGIASILIATDDGLALIDSGTEAGAEIVLSNVRTLGFDPKDVKLLLNSHEHFDHVGGMAKLQKATGAVVISSAIGIDVMVSGEAHPDDPQLGLHEPMQPISRGIPYTDDDAPHRLEYFGISPVETPGHTPGAMSWYWRSCDDEGSDADCKTIIYADSLSPSSSESYKFWANKPYLDTYYASLNTIFWSECDILLTPHPSASEMLRRITINGLEDSSACRKYAHGITLRLDERVEKESLGE